MRSSLLIFCLATCATLTAQVRYSKDDGTVSIDGKPFAKFNRGDDANKPFLAPVRSASGKIVTRGFPMEKIEGESRDHLHHRGIWFSYDEVNNVKFWENDPSYKKGNIGRIAVRELNWTDGKLVAKMDWMDSKGKVVLVEDREMVFSGDAKLRNIDFRITLSGPEEVTFGDTKEGAFAIRLAENFTERKGMKMTDADGRTGMKQIWGKRSNWVDYKTDMDGESIGVAMFDHPENPRHPTYWHARDYGLFALNPFGRKAFDSTQEESHWKLAPGQKIVFRWRVSIHPGDADVAALYQQFASK